MLPPNTTAINYKYDALGRRVERSKASGTWTRYGYDGLEVLRDVNSDGSTVEYVNGDELDDHLWQRKSDGTTHYFLTDHQGSTRGLTDANGTATASYSYDTFGNGFSSSLTRFGYTGREHDGETGLLYYRARWYDPGQGRFVSEDPIGFAGGDNFYGYVGNNPLNATDPSGLQANPKIKLPPAPRPSGPGKVIQGPWGKPSSTWGRLGRWGGLAAILMMAVIQSADNVDHPEDQPASNSSPASKDDPCNNFYGKGSGEAYYRGGSNMTPRPADMKIKDGLVQPTHGLSVHQDPLHVAGFGGAFLIVDLPEGLMIIQRGRDPLHHEIVPKEPMTPEEYADKLKQVKLRKKSC